MPRPGGIPLDDQHRREVCWQVLAQHRLRRLLQRQQRCSAGGCVCVCVWFPSGPGQKMRLSAGSTEVRCVGWGLGPWMWAAQAAGTAFRSMAISCCWAACALPDLRAPPSRLAPGAVASQHAHPPAPFGRSCLLLPWPAPGHHAPTGGPPVRPLSCLCCQPVSHCLHILHRLVLHAFLCPA